MEADISSNCAYCLTNLTTGKQDSSMSLVTAAVCTFCPLTLPLLLRPPLCAKLHAASYHLTAAVPCRLPRAATCFNTLYLPCYSSKAVMQQRLAQACSAQLMFDEGDLALSVS